jgi:hypothetical protein
VVVVLVLAATAQAEVKTEFDYGGYIKFDALSTYYRNGDVAPESPLRDFHVPNQIPVDPVDENHDLDFHVKESRFHFGTNTKIDGHEIKGFLELDFLLSKQGDEKVSNSYNPRLRHFYIATGNWLFGQTWNTFMIVVVPDDLDFAGAAEGLVFGRQPQVRYTNGPWQFSVENPETAVTGYQGSLSFVTESGRLPDLVARYNLQTDRFTGGVAVLGRQLHYKVPDTTLEDREFAYGLSVGGTLKVGQRDDLRFMATAGRGLGRYVALNFVNSAVLDSTGNLHTIDEVLGYVSYRHFWSEKLRSSANVSMFVGDNDEALTGGDVNRDAQSYSVNLIYSPFKTFSVGAEIMYARRVLQDGTDGSFGRFQFSAKYDFGYNAPVYEK